MEREERRRRGAGMVDHTYNPTIQEVRDFSKMEYNLAI